MLAGHICCTPHNGLPESKIIHLYNIGLHVIRFDSLSLIPSQPPIFGGWYQWLLHCQVSYTYIPQNRELGPYITGQPLTTWPHHPNWLKNLQPETHLDPVSTWKVDLKIGPSDLCCAASGAGALAGTSGTVAAKPIRRSAGGVMFFFPHWFGGRDGRMAVWCCGTLQGWIGLEKFWKQSLRVTVRHAHRGESSPSQCCPSWLFSIL